MKCTIDTRKGKVNKAEAKANVAANYAAAKVIEEIKEQDRRIKILEIKLQVANEQIRTMSAAR